MPMSAGADFLEVPLRRRQGILVLVERAIAVEA